jgi:transcription termination/antitermination protein NusG
VDGSDLHGSDLQRPYGHTAAQAAGAPDAAWYAVWLHSHYEQLVARHLSARGFHTFLPELLTWSKRPGRKCAVRTPMFPGYLFVRDTLDKGRYIEMLKVRGIVRVLEAGWSRLTPIPDEEIDAIRQIVQAEIPVFPHAHLRYGDRVRVLEGPLTGVEGIFVQDKPFKGRLVVSVNMLGRSVAVEMECASVEACSSEATRVGHNATDHHSRPCH